MDPNTQYYNPPDSLLPLKKKKKNSTSRFGYNKITKIWKELHTLKHSNFN